MSIFRRKSIDIFEADYPFYSKRYKKWTTGAKGFGCDGATGVPDTKEKCYRIHNWNYYVALWDNGSLMTFEEANNNYTDLLKEKGHPFKAKARKALYFVGRIAWKKHRLRELVRHNEIVLSQWKMDHGISLDPLPSHTG